MDFDFLKDRYDYELQRKEQLTSALTLPVGVLTVLGGAMVAMARTFTYENLTVSSFFLVFLLAAVVSFFSCAYRLMRAYHAQTYLFLPLLSEFEMFKEEDRIWRAYVEATGGDLSNEEDFNAWLRKRISAQRMRTLGVTINARNGFTRAVRGSSPSSVSLPWRDSRMWPIK